ncbi:hypothetical protein [Derxia lacustris]|uniref:hypothetical protein n=1 Tax=Derxia lacustris TaxID=764842 RepID=UPI00111C5EDC|nr:hypothetical protein [Derxia lacustris]
MPFADELRAAANCGGFAALSQQIALLAEIPMDGIGPDNPFLKHEVAKYRATFRKRLLGNSHAAPGRLVIA